MAEDTLPQMPEPFDYCYEWDGPYGTRKFSIAAHNGRKCDRSVPIFTADQLRAYAAQAVAQEAEARRAAQAQVAQPPSAWRPVTEELPPKNTEVLICFAGQNTLCSTGQYTGSPKDVQGWCYPWENRAATDDGSDPVVTHWQPLPPPPSAGEETNE